jgi:hypothetical protein
MKSAPIRIPVAVRAAFRDRTNTGDSDRDVHDAQAALLHPALNRLTDAKDRRAQHEAACTLVRGRILDVWVTVDDEGNVELAGAPLEEP